MSYEDGISDSETFGLLDYPIVNNTTPHTQFNPTQPSQLPHQREINHSPSNNKPHHDLSQQQLHPNPSSSTTSSTLNNPTITHDLASLSTSSSSPQQPQQRRVLRTRYSLDSEPPQTNKFILAIFGGIVTIISLMLVTIYTIRTTSTPSIPPLYRHVSTFGPKFRVDEHNQDDSTAKSDFFPSVWLPSVDRDTIVETLLSQTQTELWVPTATLYNPLRFIKENVEEFSQVPVYHESELTTLISNDYPSLSNIFISHTTTSESFPLTFPTSKQPISAYINSQHTPINTVYIIQFYAHWCGHCRRFSSHAENLAHTFNAQPTSPVRILRVHCADLSKYGQQLCQALHVDNYPTLFLATSRTWLWILNQVMPEFHQRVQMWYVRSRGSSPPPGQEKIDVSERPMEHIDPELLKKLLVRIPSSQSTAEAVASWVNTWLLQQYTSHRDKIHQQYNTFTNSGQGNNFGQNDKAVANVNDLNLLQTAAIQTLQNYLQYYNNHSFELNPKTLAEIERHNTSPSTPVVDKIVLKTSLRGFEKVEFNSLDQIEFEKVQKQLLHRSGDYQLDLTAPTTLQNWLLYGLPLDDMISYIIMPKSILNGSTFFQNMKPTRYYDPRINFNVRPSLLQGIYSGVSVFLPVNYTVLSQEELKVEMLRDVSKLPNSSSSPTTDGSSNTNNMFANGYPEKSNPQDKMLYWSIALREAIPQCHRAQMLLFTLNLQSSEEEAQHVKDLVKAMRQELSKGYTAGTGQYGKIPTHLLYTASTTIEENNTVNGGKDENGNKIKYNQYLDSQTCYEALYDMLDTLCVLTSSSTIDLSVPNDEQWSFDKQCQHSFCQLKSTLSDYLLPPKQLEQLYLSHSLTGAVPPMFTKEQVVNAESLPKFKHLLDDWQLCHKPWSYWQDMDWVQCKGSLSYTRGYTCGLWLNLHTLTTSLDQHTKANTLPQASSSTPTTTRDLGPVISPMSKLSLVIRHFFKHFFLCQECQEHFLSYSNELPFLLSTPNPIKLLTTLPQPDQGHKTDKNEEESDSHEGITPYTVSFPAQEYMVLWLWHTHNVVNQRLAQVEKQHSAADPIFPKVYFPLHHKCPDCRDQTHTACITPTRSLSSTTTTTTGSSSSKLPTNDNQQQQQQQGTTNLTDNCLWDETWSYYSIYDYLTKFYTPSS
jgi:thiol-disulfide isomerase/thioredoxin